MIFVTVGSQKFQFNRLLKQIDELVETKVINESIFAQIGNSDYVPKNFQCKKYLNRDEFREIMDQSNIVITHGGTGAIIGAVKKNKKVIAVPRLKKYGEHIDDHQIQLLKEFDEMDLIYSCYEVNELGEAIISIKEKIYKKYNSNTSNIIDSLRKYINGI